MPTVAELGALVKQKYPGTYDDLQDADLGARVKAKYPGAYDDFTDEKPAAPVSVQPVQQQALKPVDPAATVLMNPTTRQFSGPLVDPKNPAAGKLPSLDEIVQGTKDYAELVLNKISSGVQNLAIGAGSGLSAVGGMMRDGQLRTGFGAALDGPLTVLGDMLDKGIGQELVRFGEEGQAKTKLPWYEKRVANKSLGEKVQDPAYLVATGAEGLGTMLGFLAAPQAKAPEFALQSERARKVVNAIFNNLPAAAFESFVDAGSTYREAIKEGHNREDAANAFLTNLGLEIPITIATNKLGVFSDDLKGAKKIAVAPFVEAFQEAMQGATQSGAKNLALGTDEPLFLSEARAEEGLGGYLTGAIVSSLEAAAGLRRRGGSQPQASTAKSAKEVANSGIPETPQAPAAGSRPASFNPGSPYDVEDSDPDSIYDTAVEEQSALFTGIQASEEKLKTAKGKKRQQLEDSIAQDRRLYEDKYTEFDTAFGSGWSDEARRFVESGDYEASLNEPGEDIEPTQEQLDAERAEIDAERERENSRIPKPGKRPALNFGDAIEFDFDGETFTGTLQDYDFNYPKAGPSTVVHRDDGKQYIVLKDNIRPKPAAQSGKPGRKTGKHIEMPEPAPWSVKTGQAQTALETGRITADEAQQIADELAAMPRLKDVVDRANFKNGLARLNEAIAKARNPIVQARDEKRQQASESGKLPTHLGGAKPRYSFGANQFVLEFESDADRAAYIAAQEKKSKRDAEYVAFASGVLGTDEAGVREHGKRVRDAIKQQAKHGQPGKDGKPGLIKVPVLAKQNANSRIPERQAPALEPAPVDAAEVEGVPEGVSFGDLEETGDTPNPAIQFKAGGEVLDGTIEGVRNTKGGQTLYQVRGANGKPYVIGGDRIVKQPKTKAPEAAESAPAETKPVTPQVPTDGTKYVLPGFVTHQYKKPKKGAAPKLADDPKVKEAKAQANKLKQKRAEMDAKKADGPVHPLHDVPGDEGVRPREVSASVKDGRVSLTVRVGKTIVERRSFSAAEWSARHKGGSANENWNDREFMKKVFDYANRANTDEGSHLERVIDAAVSKSKKVLSQDSAPLAALKDEVTGAIERGEKEPIVEQPTQEAADTIIRNALEALEPKLVQFRRTLENSKGQGRTTLNAIAEDIQRTIDGWSEIAEKVQGTNSARLKRVIVDLRALQAEAASLAESPAPRAKRSFKYQLKIHGEGDKWHDNAVRFATREEAEKAGDSKFSAWTMAEDYQVVESDEAPNYRWDEENGTIAALAAEPKQAAKPETADQGLNVAGVGITSMRPASPEASIPEKPAESPVVFDSDTDDVQELVRRALKKKAEEARARIRAKAQGGTLASGIDPQDIVDLAYIGADLIADGTLKVQKWTAAMREEFGSELKAIADKSAQTVDRVLEAIRDRAEDLFEQITSDAKAAVAARKQASRNGDTLKPEQSNNGKQQPSSTEPSGARDRGALEGTPSENGGGTPEDAGSTAESGVRGAGTNGRSPSQADGGGQDAVPPGTGDSDADVGTASGRGDSPRTRRRSRDLDRATSSRDYRITDEDRIGESGDKTRFRNNLEAIRTLKKIQEEGRTEATDEEKKILVKYVGWGALSQKAFEYSHEWSGAQEELKALIGREEYEAARKSTKNAHYTSREVINAMWTAAKRLGIHEDSRILEPAAGVGHFLGLQPADMLPARRTAVEIDNISAGITKLLYPDSNVLHMGYQAAPLPNNYFDLAISNVPFGKYGVADPKFKRQPRLTKSIHSYFFAKAMDQVRPGGVVAFITSSFTMDEVDSGVRRYLAGKADLLGAIRLPGGRKGAFARNAGTQVTTDIIFLQKRAPQTERSGESWEALANVKGRNENDEITDIPVNEYFARHPEMMLGEMALQGTMHANSNEKVLLGEMTPENLAEAIGRLPENVVSYVSTSEAFEAQPVAELPAAGIPKDGGFGIKDGAVIIRQGNTWRPADVPKETAERIKGMIAVRDAVREVYRTQWHNAPEDEILAARKKLNTIYDKFVRTKYKTGGKRGEVTFGPLSTKENFKAFAGDPDHPLLLSLEEYDPSTNTARKAKVFSERTIQGYTPVTKTDNAADALTISLAEVGRIDWMRMQDLTGKSPEELQDELGELIYKNPESGRWEQRDEYLSGNVRAKLKQAQAIAKTDPAFQRNVEALEAVQPADLKPSEISVRLGAPWIEPDYVKSFLVELLELPAHQAENITVQFSEAVGQWAVHVAGDVRTSGNNNAKWGFAGIRADELVELALNLKAPKLYMDDPDSPDPKRPRRIIDTDATVGAEDKQRKINDEFKKWVWKNDERAGVLARKYNDEYNNIRLREFDGSHLKFPGMARLGLRNHDLDKHQKDAIWRIMQTGNTLLAHVVGAGKTYEMIAAGMEMKRVGLVRKPVYVVPNHLVNQWAKEFMTLYPQANIFVAGKETFQTGKRQLAAARIASGNYDAIILSHKSFEYLPVSDATFQQFVDEQTAEIKQALDKAETDEAEREKNSEGKKRSKRKSPTIKALETALERLETEVQKRSNRDEKDRTIDFEELGIDQMFVDEAHLYKNLYYVTKMDRVAGLPNSSANRSMDMFIKTRFLSERSNQRGVVFATGTPISNSMAEMYTMQRYLQMPALKALGLDHFDNWSQAFGEVVNTVELKPEGNGFRMNKRFAKFVNVPELIKMFRSVADVKNADDLNLPRPAIEGGKATMITAPGSPLMQELQAELNERADRIRSTYVDPEIDNMLKIMFEGRMAALDIRLRYPDAPDDPNSKVNLAVRNIADIYREGTAELWTQSVFLDMSMPKGKKDRQTQAEEDAELGEAGDGEAVPDAATVENFESSVYEDIKAKLIARGIPANEIKFIHEAKNDEQKQRLFDDVNAGRVRIIIGSTEKMGAGTNIQVKMKALHHLDVPWRPSDIEQRNGRIQRPGNTHQSVRIFHYATEGSLDAYMWQTILAKAKFIGRAMSGDMSIREMEDTSVMVMSAAEFMAVSSGDPSVKERTELEIDVRRLESLRQAHEDELFSLRQQLRQSAFDVRSATESAAHLQPAIDQAAAWGDKHPLAVNGSKEKKPGGKDLMDVLHSMDGLDGRITAGTYMGFPLVVEGRGMYVPKKGDPEPYFPNLKLQIPGWNTIVNVGRESDPGGLMNKLRWMVHELPAQQAHHNEQREKAQRKLDQLSAQDLNRPFEEQKKLDEKRARLAVLDAKLDKDKGDVNGAGKKATVVDGVSMGQYKPLNKPLEEPKDGWYTGAAEDGENLFGNGEILFRGETPGKADIHSTGKVTGSWKRLADLPAQRVYPVGYSVKDRRGLVWFTDGKFPIDRDYFDAAIARSESRPDFERTSTGMIRVVAGGKVLGYVAGLRETAPSGITVQLERAKPNPEPKTTGDRPGPVYMGSGLGALQPYMERAWDALYTRIKDAAKSDSAKAARDFFRPTGSRIAELGTAGAKLHGLFIKARDEGETAAGMKVARLVYDTGIRDLTPAERIDLTDALEGKKRPGAKLLPIFKEVRSILDELGAEAVRLDVKVQRHMRLGPMDPIPEGVKLTGLEKMHRDLGRTITVRARVPFQPRKNYYPHRIPHPDQLKSGKIREAIVANMVRRGYRTDKAAAEKFLDNYIEYVETGKRAEKLTHWLVRTGQASNHAEALTMLEAMRENVIRRQPSLEFSRSVDLPFWDPDALRVLPGFVTAQAKRLAQIENFGQDHQKLTRLRSQVRKKYGKEAAEFVLRATKEVLGTADHDVAMTKLSAKLRSVQAMKLGMAFVANTPQGFVSTWFNGDFRAAATGLKAAFTREGQRFGVESGAALESSLRQAMQNAAEDGGAFDRALGVMLKPFTATERSNRVVSSNGGADYARRQLMKLKLNPKHAGIRQRLTELGLDVDAALKRGSLTEQELRVAGNRFAGTTQFRGDVLENPLFSASPVGKLFWQFKQYGYGQARLMANTLRRDWQNDRPRLVRDLLILGSVYPMSGLVISSLRNLLKGGDDEKDKTLVAQYFEYFFAAGAFGVVTEMMQAGKFGKAADTILGPTLGTAAGALNAAAAAANRQRNKMEPLEKFIVRQLPFGSAIAGWMFGEEPKRRRRVAVGM